MSSCFKFLFTLQQYHNYSYLLSGINLLLSLTGKVLEAKEKAQQSKDSENIFDNILASL